MDQALSQRYAPPPAWRRPLTIGLVAVVAVVALAWLAWAAFVEATPKVESSLLGWKVADAHHATAQVDVRITSSARHPSCTVQAYATDHSIVGELSFTPVGGRNDVTVRTVREATSVDLAGCVAQGQDQPR